MSCVAVWVAAELTCGSRNAAGCSGGMADSQGGLLSERREADSETTGLWGAKKKNPYIRATMSTI